MGARERSQAVNEYIAAHNAYREDQLTTLQNKIKSLEDILQHYLFIDLTNESATPIQFHISNNIYHYEKHRLNQLIDEMASVDTAIKVLETTILPLVNDYPNSQNITGFDKEIKQIVRNVWNDLFANTTVRTLDGNYQLSPKSNDDIQFIGFISSQKIMTSNQSVII